jgi:hypothetical protein
VRLSRLARTASCATKRLRHDRCQADAEATFRSHEKSTAELLGYDLSKLTPAQSVRLDRAASIRLEIDDLQSKQLAGLPFDLKTYVLASEALERLVGGDPQKPATDAFAGARDELLRFLDQRAEALERRAERDEKNKAIPNPGGDAQYSANTQANAQLAVVGSVPEGDDSPPPSNVRHTYIDHAVLAEPLPTAEQDPLRHSSMNNPASVPLPRKPTEQSATYSAFADYEARRRSGFRRFDMPDGF